METDLSPRGGTFLTAEWTNLLMINYEVPRERLEPLVPAGAMLDTYRGRAYVSLVGFLFRNTRLKGFRVPFHQNFEEVNLRFYVRRLAGDEWRRGVVFIREIVPRAAIAATARWFYNEPYVRLPMRHRVEVTPDRAAVSYEWEHEHRWLSMHGMATGAPRPLIPGTPEEFMTEHYWGYTRQTDGSTVEYQVEHPPWRVWTDVETRVKGSFEGLYPGDLIEPMAAPPASALIADGSPVKVFHPATVESYGSTAGNEGMTPTLTT